jgi:hypothetical protein
MEVKQKKDPSTMLSMRPVPRWRKASFLAAAWH